ncbi:EAL domain-containing protein [Arsukibacterium indicum]|uniref:EAL domain-containing protein n=1 Tax=Arsukibacterium indicum TaxID=2848612 RepID=A0ABS6ML87_9GAMM|nr:EAL domain-containing protein [Arsukibacterium indicum]MBV2129582.1 EAL domain-containing protein [Arsukibacterium indicum]
MLLGLLLIVSASTVAQKPLLQPLTPDQGLSQGTVRDLMIDSNGFLWVATEGGLNRFDANKVTHMHAAEHNSNDVAFSQIIEDRQGRIWAAAESIGLYLYDKDRGVFDLFITIPTDNEQPQYQHLIDVIDQDKDHLLYIVDDKVHRLNKNTANSTLLYSLTEDNIENGWLRTLFLYNDQLFIGSFNGLIQYDLATDSHHYIPYLDNKTATDDQQQVKHLSIAAGRLYIGTVEGLYSVSLNDLEAAKPGSELANQPLHARHHIADYNIWQMHWLGDTALVATEQGLFKFSSDDNTLQFLLRFSDSDLGVYDNNIVELVADNFGGYWLASRDDGVFYWHPRSLAFEHISRQTTLGKSLSNDKIYQLAADTNDNLWIGTSNGLNKVNVATGVTQSYFVSDDLKATWHSGTIVQVMLDPNDAGLLWFVSSDGLNLFDIETGKKLPLPVADEQQRSLLGSSSYYYYATRQPENSQFYFSHDAKVYRYTPATGLIKELEVFQQLPMHYYGGIVGEMPGNPEQLLVTTSDQLWLYDSQLNTLTQLYLASPYQPELQRYADQMVSDDYGILWLGINSIGLLGFDRDTLELKHHFSTANKLIAQQIYALQKDDAGDIWFSSHSGLSKLQPDTLQIEHFSKADGLRVHEYNGTASAVLADGRLAFGSMRGITLVDPAKLASLEPRPEVNITDISVLSGNFQARSGLLNNNVFQLDHADVGIQLQFSAMHFRDNHKMRYRFWLEGRNTLHYPEQQANSVVFPTLRSGNYRFNVVAIAPHTGLESEVSSVALKIAPAPWRSTWAMVFYAVIALALLYHFYRLRREQQQIISEAHQEVAISEQRLKQALASVDSGAFEWRADKNSLYGSRMQLMLGYGELMNNITLQQHLSLIHPEDRENYQQQWQRFLQQPDSSFDITYRLKHKGGHWLWFRDQGRATELGQNQQVELVTGTYSNITETRANMEKAKLFGEAFQQTRDWVVILDNKQRVIAANQSFSTAFGSVEQYLDNPRTHHLGISLVRRRFYTKLLHELKAGAHWQGEEQVITPDGRERPTLINISAIGEQQQVAFYVLVFTDITAQKMAEEELRYLANYDSLTGLPNRALLMDRILHAMEQSRREKKSLALCFIDLDKFKQVNDSLGHDIGDLLLKEVARRLGLSLRERDTVARLGGDEFVVLLEGYRRGENVSMVARKMLSVVSEPMQLGPHTVGVSPSIGIALYPDDALTAQELLKHADVAMYHAKEAGRNNFQFFTNEMNEKAHMQLARETRLRKAHQNNEFFNVYQPIVDSAKQEMVGAEVLMRWQSTDGIVSPVEFIPLAEELRLIVSMTQQLLERALADLSQWRQNGIDIYLSVNLATQHLEQTNLASHTASLLNKYNLPASCLRFEVTESALMNDQQSAIETMLALSALGVQLALDDFGTGYSSLKYLKQLPIDAIKIDRSFVSDIGIDKSDETIIDAMLSMASSLGIYCIAEGVETTEQLAFFTDRHCTLIQGYFYSKPLIAEQIPLFWQQVKSTDINC